MITLVLNTRLTERQTNTAFDIYKRYKAEDCALSCIPLIKEALDAALINLAEQMIEDLQMSAQYSREFIMKTLAGEHPTAEDGRAMLGKPLQQKTA